VQRLKIEHWQGYSFALLPLANFRHTACRDCFESGDSALSVQINTDAIGILSFIETRNAFREGDPTSLASLPE
jgi:hypothetical protein